MPNKTRVFAIDLRNVLHLDSFVEIDEIPKLLGAIGSITRVTPVGDHYVLFEVNTPFSDPLDQILKNQEADSKAE